MVSGGMRISISRAMKMLLPAILILAVLRPASIVKKAAEFIYIPGRRTATIAAFTGEPSHVRMCRMLLDRIDSSDSDFEEILFKEDEAVCKSTKPFTATKQIFASAFLSELSGEYGLSYEHDCTQWERECEDGETIQESIPSPVLTTPFDSSSDLGVSEEDLIQTLCNKCIADQAAGVASPDCVLLPDYENKPQPGTSQARELQEYIGVRIFEQVLPWMRETLKKTTSDWLSEVAAKKLLFWIRPVGKFINRVQEDEEVAVIHLASVTEGCRDANDDCDCFMGIPFFHYAGLIPRSVTNILIMTPPYCAKEDTPCMAHAYALDKYLSELYPRAEVNYHSTPSTSATYVKMLAAHHLIVPPSDYSLIAALVRDRHLVAGHSVSRMSTHLTSYPAYSWVNDITRTTSSYIKVMTDYESVCSSNLQLYSGAGMPPGFCRHARGRIGQWQQDMDFAAKLQYETPLQHYFGLADRNYEPTTYEPYRKPTTYKWTETLFNDCPVDLLDPDEFCSTINCLGLTRIFIVGGNVAKNHAMSLWKLLGNDDDPADPSSAADPNWVRTVQCSQPSEFELTIEFVHNEKFVDNTLPVGPGVPNCGESFCYPWKRRYREYLGNTLLIFNTGMHHVGDYDSFKTTIDDFLTAMDVFNRPDDLILFRSLVPGHLDCKKPGIPPFIDYEEYCSSITDMNGWNELPEDNDYVIREVMKYNDVVDRRGAPIEILDVFPMTSFRPDGHLAGDDCVNCNFGNDCLHYSLPGPVDFWNHLMASNLKDICTERTV